MYKKYFVAVVLFLIGAVCCDELRAQQPIGIVLDSAAEGLSRIYPPFDTAGWNRTRATERGIHDGDDFYAEDWTIAGTRACHSQGHNLYAGISGIALLNRENNGVLDGYGNTIVIYDSATGFALRYAHMQEFSTEIADGRRVEAGQYLGKVGATGDMDLPVECGAFASNASHLHIALYRNVRGADARPINSVQIESSLTKTEFSANFTYTTPYPLIEHNSALFVLKHNVASSVTSFVYDNQGWNFDVTKTVFNPLKKLNELEFGMLSLSPEYWPPRDGALIQNEGTSTVYQIQSGQKRSLSLEEFHCRGYRFGIDDVACTGQQSCAPRLLNQAEVDNYSPSKETTALSGCAANAGPLRNTAPFGFLELPNQDSTVTGAAFQVRAWVLDREDAILHIDFLVDGRVISSSPARGDRPDVCASSIATSVSHCATSQPGVAFVWNTFSFSDGPHLVEIRATDPKGLSSGGITQLLNIANTGVSANPDKLNSAERLPITKPGTSFSLSDEPRSLYVSNAGHDSNGGSFDDPFQTIGKCLSVITPGSSCIVRGGTYAEYLGGLSLPKGTSWTNSITVSAFPGETVTLTTGNGGSIFDAISSKFPENEAFYFVLKDLIFDATGVENAVGGVHATHIRMENCEVKNAMVNGILPHGSYWEFINLDVHHNGSDGRGHGIYLTGSDNLIDGGRYHHNLKYGIHIYDWDSFNVSRNVVRNAQSHDNLWGLIITSGSDNVAYNNVIYNNHSGNGASISDSGMSTRNQLYNNTIYGNAGAGISVGEGANDAVIRNNTVYNNGVAIVDKGSGTTQDNNLLTDPGIVVVQIMDF